MWYLSKVLKKTLGLFVPTCRTGIFLILHVSASWKPSWTSMSQYLTVLQELSKYSDFSHLNSTKAVSIGILAFTLMCGEIFVQAEEENKPPGFQTVQMAWKMIHLIIQVSACALPPRDPRVPETRITSAPLLVLFPSSVMYHHSLF